MPGARLRGPGGKLSALAPHFLAHLFYVHSLVYGDINAPGFVAINHVTWSLEVEIQFYLLAPWLCRVFLVRDRWRRRALVAAVIAASYLFTSLHPIPAVSRTVIAYLHYFLMGFLLVDVYVADWKGVLTKSAWWDGPGLAAWLFMPFAMGLGKWVQPVMPVLVIVAYLGAMRGRYLGLFFRHRLVTAVGGMCYTLYLYHSQMIWWVRDWLERFVFGPVVKGQTATSLAQLAVTSLCIVAICAVMYVVFEKPFMRRDWHRRLFARPAPAPAPAPSADVVAG